MKKPIRTLCALLAAGAGSLVAQAQPALKILVVDMAKLYDTHWESVENNTKLQEASDKAKEDVAKLNTEGNIIVEEYKALVEQANNPALTTDAKAKAQADAQKKLQTIQQKKQEVEIFMQNTERSLQQRVINFRAQMLEKISKVAVEVGKRRGATLVLDKAGPTQFGISSLIYFDSAYEITDEVAKDLAKDRPANAPGATSSGPSPITLPPISTGK
jgi:outer membrane protein